MYKIYKNNKIKKQKGFTLLETLVAIFILTLAITGPIYISSLSLRNTIESRDIVSAQYLAEEVVEVVKNNMDTNSLKNTAEDYDFLSFISSCVRDTTTPAALCHITTLTTGNTISYSFSLCNEGICPNMLFDPEKKVIYGESDGSNQTYSKFIREFYIVKNLTNQDEAEIVVNIKWENTGKNKKYTLKKSLYNIDYKYFFNS